MTRRSLTVMAMAALLLPAGVAAAGSNKPKDQKTNGEIVGVGDDRLQLKTKKGTVTVLLTQKPRIAMGETEVSASALKRGMKVTVVGKFEDSGEIVAREIRLPAPPTNPQTPMPSGHSGHAH
ncbi:MAG: hypothetical protein HY820_16145 [Acidobacteria bacterium]|nr:hypothetical protein [Acidobacteriota bacterium]